MRLSQRLVHAAESAWPSASLRTYLLAVILLAMLPLAAFMTLGIVRDVRTQQSSIEDDLNRSAAALARAIERELASSVDALNVLAQQSELFQQGRITALGRLLQGRPRRDWDSVFVLDPGGTLILDSAAMRSPAGVSKPLRLVHQTVMRTGQPAVSTLAVDPPPQGRFIAVALPVLQDGRVRYVLGARIGEPVWQRLTVAAGAPREARAALFDANNQLISQSTAIAPAGSVLPADAAFDMRRQKAGVHRSTDVAGNEVIAAWNRVQGADWHVRVVTPAAPIDASRRNSILVALSTSSVSLLLGLLLAALVARRIARPLRQLATSGPDGLASRVPVREIALLRDALAQAQAQDSAAHRSMQARAQEFETLFSSSPIALAFAQDPACRTIWHNAAMDALLGPGGSHSAGSVQVRRAGRPLAPGQQPLQRAAALGETITGMELEIAVQGRPPVYVIANAVPLHDSQGRPRGAISAMVDITQRKEAEARLLAIDEKLRETQRLTELAQEAGHVGFFHYRFEPDRLAWTPGMCKLFGLPDGHEGTLGDWLARIDVADRDRIEREFWTACALRKEKETLDYGVIRPDGVPRWLSSRVMLHFDADGKAFQMTGVTVDMTDQKEIERSRARLTENAHAARLEAEAASRAKDEFLTMLSHELRNPLGAISAAVDVLESADPATPMGAEARAIIARQTRNLAHMMNDLLDVGRVIAGKILLERHPVNLASVVRRVDQTLALTGEARRHPLEFELADAWTEGDSVRMEQVVTNLMTNALKYTPAGCKVRVGVAREGALAVLTVHDAGLGIPSALLPHIFDLFVQGHRTLDRRAGGLGIGLTLVRRLIELHGGTVNVESSHQGSRFTVRLPAIEPPEVHPDHYLPALRRRKVLVVEDNKDVLSALRAKLELDGHTVSTADDGIEGLDRLLRLRPEVSIIDIGLPGLTGYELARHARAAGYAGRMIALSGYGAERDVREALIAGFDAYLVKPVDRNDLRASLSAD